MMLMRRTRTHALLYKMLWHLGQISTWVNDFQMKAACISKRFFINLYKNTLKKSQKSNHHIEHCSAQHSWERPKFHLKSPNQEVFLKPEHSFYNICNFLFFFIVMTARCSQFWKEPVRRDQKVLEHLLYCLNLIKRLDFTFHDSYNQNTVLPYEIQCACV